MRLLSPPTVCSLLLTARQCGVLLPLLHIYEGEKLDVQICWNLKHEEKIHVYIWEAASVLCAEVHLENAW